MPSNQLTLCPPPWPQERELELQKEQRRQEENDRLRQEFAQHANAFHQWIQETRCGPGARARDAWSRGGGQSEERSPGSFSRDESLVLEGGTECGCPTR